MTRRWQQHFSLLIFDPFRKLSVVIVGPPGSKWCDRVVGYRFESIGLLQIESDRGYISGTTEGFCSWLGEIVWSRV